MLNIFIWGTGIVAENTMHECKTLNVYNILGFIDNNKEKTGMFFFEKPVYSPLILEKIKPDVIVVLAEAFDAIKRQIQEQYPDLSSIVENKSYFYKASIQKRYRNSTDQEILDILNFIKDGELDVFNYSFAAKYKNINVDVYYDDANKLYYVLHDGKKLYFSRRFKTENSVKIYYRSILMEQDEASPHKYLSEDHFINEGDIVVDVGAAEGNFSLEIIDKASKIYLIEADDEWIEALRYTFKDYANKVTIIKSFVSSYDEGDFSTLDELIKEPVDFIKMDIEGNEWDALNGATCLIENSKKLKMVICAYHGDFDQELIESFMYKHNFSFEHSNGYMWFSTILRQTYISTKLNRALIRGTKR